MKRFRLQLLAGALMLALTASSTSAGTVQRFHLSGVS
jgi:hypothetical protein